MIGLIFPDFDLLKKNNISDEQLPELLETIRKAVNDKIPDYMQVSKFRLHPEEFAKTPKRSIRRFLYTKE
jgi:long-chain acyl-CoA synthetase